MRSFLALRETKIKRSDIVVNSSALSGLLGLQQVTSCQTTLPVGARGLAQCFKRASDTDNIRQL
jgi:hypothetical protein